MTCSHQLTHIYATPCFLTSSSIFVRNVPLYTHSDHNLTTHRMWLNLGAIFKRLSHDPDVRCVVLTAAGDRAFTAGLDVQVRSCGSVHPMRTLASSRQPEGSSEHALLAAGDCMLAQAIPRLIAWAGGVDERSLGWE